MTKKYWEARKSQYSEFLYYFVLAIIYLLVAIFVYPRIIVNDEITPLVFYLVIAASFIPLLIIAWTILSTYMTKYTLTSERLLITTGVINRITNTIELYRVTDYRLDEPINLRLFGAVRFNIYSADNSTPSIALYINQMTGERGLKFMSAFRNAVESSRLKSGVRTFEGF